MRAVMRTSMKWSLKWIIATLTAWRRFRASIREGAECFTRRLHGWKLAAWTTLILVLAVGVYGFLGVQTYQWAEVLISSLPVSDLVHWLAVLAALAWLALPLVWSVLARRALTVLLYELVIHDEDWLCVDTQLTLAVPDKQVIAQAVDAAIKLFRTQGEECIALEDLDVEINAFYVPAQAFGRARWRQMGRNRP